MSIKVMVVDDAPFIREIFKQLFDSEGYNFVGEATNGNEAIALIPSVLPDVVIMDLVMPEKNGLDTTKEILENFPHIKIIACSTLDDPSMEQKAKDAGCVAYIPKPFTKELIEQTVQRVFND